MSGYAIDLERYSDIRVVRFLRDPRDMLVSGYFYHKRGGESWTRLDEPNEVDWRVVNGCVPSVLPRGTSLAAYLNEVDIEAGLLAEIEFRTRHFDSMMDWPVGDDRILEVRYEDILGRERQSFREILAYLELPSRAVRIG